MPGAYSSGYSGAYGSGPSGVITATPPSRIYVVTHGDEASCINKFQPKDPDAILDYGFDWSGWLAAGESIASHEIIADNIETDTGASLGGVVTVWTSGGQNLTTARITCRITTDNIPARADERTALIRIRER